MHQKFVDGPAGHIIGICSDAGQSFDTSRISSHKDYLDVVQDLGLSKAPTTDAVGFPSIRTTGHAVRVQISKIAFIPLTNTSAVWTGSVNAVGLVADTKIASRAGTEL